jgi:hypothetical protein
MSLNGHRPRVRVHEPGEIKLPPHNLDFEREVLGTVIAHPEHLPLVASVLDVEDLYRDSHQLLFRTLLELRSRGIPIDARTVDEELTRTDRLPSIGGREGYWEILNRAGTGGPLVHYVQEIRAKGLARQLLQAGEDLEREVHAGLKTPPDLASDFARRLAAIVAHGDPGPEGITDRWPKPDPRVYHGISGRIVHLAAPHTEADPIAILVQFLAASGNMIGHSPHFAVGPTSHHLNLFACLVGPTSSGRKGTSWDIARWMLGSIDETWLDCVKGGLTSGEGLIYHVRDDEETPIDRRMMVVETEFSRVLKAAAREQNTLSDVIRQAWDSGNLRTLSKNQPLKATNAHVSLIGHITQADLRRHMSQTDSLNGFANRFLWLAVRRSQFLPDGDTLHLIDWAEVHRHLRHVIPWAREQGKIVRDLEARDLWHEHYRRLTGGRVDTLGAILSRAEAQVMRLACLYALLDGSEAIRADHLAAALALWDFTEASARLIFGDTLRDSSAEKLIAALKASPEGLSRWDITTDVFKGHKPREEIDAILADLLTQGLICRERRPTRGRPLEIWRLEGSEGREVSEESPRGTADRDIEG